MSIDRIGQRQESSGMGPRQFETVRSGMSVMYAGETWAISATPVCSRRNISPPLPSALAGKYLELLFPRLEKFGRRL